VQEIVNRGGWSPSNALALIFSGTGVRTAESFDGLPAAAATLFLEYIGADLEHSVRIASSSDDVEERDDGTVVLNSNDLELVFDAGGNQFVGLRFTDIPVPRDAAILEAYVQFKADAVNTGSTSLQISAEASDDAATFVQTLAGVSLRPTVGNAVTWNPVPWNHRGQAGPKQRTPDLGGLIQTIVSRPGWSAGNALALIVSGSGERVAKSYDRSRPGAPLLYIRYQ